MTATIKLLGHSGLDIQLGDTRVVCDPWLSGQGAYLGSRHPFPGRGSQPIDATTLHDTPLLFISNPRPDHFDVDTVSGFPRTVRVIVPAFPSPALADKLRALGLEDIVELADWQPFDLPDGGRLMLVKGSPSHVLGATLILEAGGQVVIDQNVCHLDDETLARLATMNATLHFVGFSGDSYFPSAYDYSPEQAQRYVDEQRGAALLAFIAAAGGVGARNVVPISGPPCFLDDRGFELNFGGSIFFDVDQLQALVAAEAPSLAERLRPLYPGDVATTGPDGTWHLDGHRPYEEKRRYLEDYRETRAPQRAQHLADLRAQALPVDAKEMRNYLRELFQYDDMTWDMGILLQVRLSDGPSVWIDFRKKPFRYHTECDEPAQHVLTTESAWLSLVIQQKLSWHDLLMGHQATLRREPDQECPSLTKHLDFRHDAALFELVRKLNPALITIQDEQNEYVCQRFCPHRGRDLEYAILERGVLTCTAHGWRFDLRKGGRCLWGGDTPLLVKEIRPLKK
jgi:UDP-MurNAc hydroxylase